jgi:hypothetical protein
MKHTCQRRLSKNQSEYPDDSSDKSDDRCSETNHFGDDVHIAVGISNTEKASSSDISDDGDERLSLSHAVDKTEISTGIVLEGDGRSKYRH